MCLLLCRAAKLFGRAGSMLKDAGSSMAGATVSMAHQAQAAAAKARAAQVSRSHARPTRPLHGHPYLHLTWPVVPVPARHDQPNSHQDSRRPRLVLKDAASNTCRSRSARGYPLMSQLGPHIRCNRDASAGCVALGPHASILSVQQERRAQGAGEVPAAKRGLSGFLLRPQKGGSPEGGAAGRAPSETERPARLPSDTTPEKQAVLRSSLHTSPNRHALLSRYMLGMGRPASPAHPLPMEHVSRMPEVKGPLYMGCRSSLEEAQHPRTADAAGLLDPYQLQPASPAERRPVPSRQQQVRGSSPERR